MMPSMKIWSSWQTRLLIFPTVAVSTASNLYRTIVKWLLLTGLVTVLFVFGAKAATPNFVQGNSGAPQASESTLTVAYTASQSAGDLNVVIVG
jgi:hypothetical protein